MSRIGAVSTGPGSPVRVMGILNASPESFYGPSISATRQEMMDRAKSIEDEGGDFVDVGGMSTAPYLETMIPESVEAERVLMALQAVQNACNLPISVDTCRSSVAEGALRAGATIVNDITGLKYDDVMGKVIGRYGASVILCAYGGASAGTATRQQRQDAAPSASDAGQEADPVCRTRTLLLESLHAASAAGIPIGRMALDPSFGFFRRRAVGPFYTGMVRGWTTRDVGVLARLGSVRLRCLPVAVSVSNKSFLGRILKRKDPSERLYGSVAAETIAVLNGADIIRTHNVRAARDAAAVASKIARASNAGAAESP